MPKLSQAVQFFILILPYVSAGRRENHDKFPGFVYPTNGICQDYTFKDTVTYPELQWGLPVWKDDYDTAAFLFNLSSKDAHTPFFSGAKNVTETFELSATFCAPKDAVGDKVSTVLVASHGLGFDRRYWASSYKPETYSFAYHVLKAGYSIFYYDRLGVGKSQRVSGFVNQAAPQIALLADIVKAIRAGKYTGAIKTQKVGLVGHSFGSYLSNAIMGSYPSLVDAAALTGMAYANASDPAATAPRFVPSIFASRIASQRPASLAPQFAQTFDTGYIGFGDEFAYAESFLHQPDYTTSAEKYSYSISQPFAVAEFLTLASIGLDSPGFKGKVLVTDGQFDQLLCDGDCMDTYERGLQNDIFRNAAEVRTYLQGGAGHGQNFASNADELYKEITEFFDAV